MSSTRTLLFDFGQAGNLPAALGSVFVLDNSIGHAGIAFYLTVPTGGAVVFEASFDGVTFTTITLRAVSTNGYTQVASANDVVIGSIASVRVFRVRVTTAGSAPGSVIGRTSPMLNTLEGSENSEPNTFDLQLARGRIALLAGNHKFGRNPDIDGAQETVWAQGGIYTFSGSAVTYYASSSSAADVGIPITCDVLDGTYVATSRAVNLNGQNQVAISGGACFRINRAYNSGSVACQGIVYIAEQDSLTAGVPQTASKIKAILPVLDQQTQQCVFTVPAGKTGYVTDFTSSSNNIADIYVQTRLQNGVFRTRSGSNVNGFVHVDFNVYLQVPEKTDVKVDATSTNNNTNVTVEFNMILDG